MSAYVQTMCGSDSPPIGAIMDYAGNVEPSGWLFCFGQSLPRAGIYSDLFNVIGTLYGSLDSSSFSLPDFRGRVGAGRDNMGGTAANRLQAAWGVDGVTLGANGGSQSHQLTVAQMPAHNHSYSFVSTGTGLQGGTSYGTPQTNTSSAGGDGAHPNVQPTFIINRIIKYTIAAVVLPIVPGTGDVTGPNGGVADGDLAVYNGTSGKILKGGSRLLDGLSAGTVIQTVATMDASFASTNAIIPFDDTIPQNTEGVAINPLDTAITPLFANSKVLLRFEVGMSQPAAGGQWIIVALFRDTVTSAIAARFVYGPAPAGAVTMVTLTYVDIPGAGAHTYRMRFGTNTSASSISWNGGGSRFMGGVSVMSLIAQEIKV